MHQRPSPVAPVALAVPAEDGFRLDDDEGVLPLWPVSGDPEDAILTLKTGAVYLATEDVELLAEGGDLEEEIGTTAEGEAEGGGDLEEGGEHGGGEIGGRAGVKV